MGKIIQLDDNTVKKIAAGEVIERPSSVVKELVENSIDAGADEVTVEINKGGIDLIRTKDNGSGMSKEDALFSFQLHTTSKLKTIEDLERVYTFGFRGEALASITSVSQVIIHTSNSSESNELIIENGELISTTSKPRTQGITITVNDLFRHLPARKKFLRSEGTEYRHVLLEVTKIALAYPQISITLVHNDKTQVSLPKTESLAERIKVLFGGIKDHDLIEIKLESPIAQIVGYIIHPDTLSMDRSKQFLFLNKRYINEKSLSKAVRDGYQTTISRDKQPAYFIFLEIDPSTIDINIHPRKLEAKIDRIGEIFGMLSNTIKKVIDSRLQNNLKEKLGSFTNSNTLSDTTTTYNYSRDYKPQTDSIPFKFSPNQPTPKNSLPWRHAMVQESLLFSKNLLENQEPQNNHNYFQVLDTYIIIDRGSGLEMIDQHAADERINFEKISEKVSRGEFVEKKDLLIPIILDLDVSKLPIIENNLEIFGKYGLDIDIFGYNKIRINTIPVFAREIKYTELIDELIENIEHNSESKLIESMSASLACHSSIRAGRKMNPLEMQKLIDDLFKCQTPYSCPHGRPIIWTIPKNEIEKKFERKK